MNTKLLVQALIVATVLQLVMVISGHWVELIKGQFAAIGTGISIVGAIHYVRAAKPSWVWAGLGGAIVGGVSALIGIAVSYMLGDVTADILYIGTGASTVAAAIGGLVMRIFAKPAAA